MTLVRAVKIAAAIGGPAAVSIATAADGQTVDVERPRALVVGSPPIGATTPAASWAPAGVSTVRLPTAPLHAEWRVSLGVAVDQPAVVDAHGTIYAVGDRGDVIALSATGEELWRAATGFAQPGQSTVLSDDALVFVDGGGEAVAVRDRSVRWRTRFARGNGTRLKPLALDDGGAIVAAGEEIAVLDSAGHERARLGLPQEAVAVLPTGSARIAIVTADATIWSWTPGAAEPTRVGSFGARIDDAPALGSGHLLFAVTGGARLVAADLSSGSLTVRASANANLWLGPPTVRGDTVSVLALTASGELALAFDGGGVEVGRAWVGPSSIAAVDGGAQPRGSAARAAPLADSDGTLVFATADGALGVVARLDSSQPVVERLADACAQPAARAPVDSSVVGITPLRPNAFLAVCRGGTVLAVRGSTSGGN